jgi:hypothetical protein
MSAFHLPQPIKLKITYSRKGAPHIRYVVTGNTVIDALHWIQSQDKCLTPSEIKSFFALKSGPEVGSKLPLIGEKIGKVELRILQKRYLD